MCFDPQIMSHRITVAMVHRPRHRCPDRAQRGDNAGAREIARLMPTHAIGDRPNTYAGAEIRAVEKRILVALPDQPNMGQPM